MNAARTTTPANGARPATRWPGPVGFVAVGVLLLVAPLVLSPFRLDLLAKYLCYAIVAVGIYLAWGRGGMLTLGQGVFFGLGGYAMGMHLKLADAGEGNLPDFMVWSGVETLPAIWGPFRSPAFALVMVVVLPTVVALILGTLVFRQRVRGAYFAVLSQALAAAFVILLVGQQGLTGGTNGLTNVQFFFGLDLYDPTQKRIVYYVAVGALALVFLAAWQLTHSRFGKLLVAIRDGEDRVRFLGYDPAVVKTIVYALSAAMAGIAGALFVPVVGILGPADLGVVPSIEMLVAVAIGGRFSLVGAVGGAILFNYGSTVLSEQWPSGWLYLLGGLFIAVMMWAPRGLAGLLADGWAAVRHRVGGAKP
ncbi:MULTISPECIES: urea ABC transporter permease subunit UrtC [unclassified Solwaraspora]|uniref:urea ABC transporter permease subunit UrtC n=1 Tax=unclassified Solwaraspora TaxID=2627926 RepID=UPI00248AE8F5|nr:MULTISPECIES: urea ABC transporter permease subunit UrtC [unclassified Solwaraspora]WBB99146.1 urea ABC transporter permease subunit UrtC [Solwaraspora sp. WMMA2059]WBC22301.1 urea ABC transporter permease subunit UrtC [Solwaraspora sp. WMMA2080]WJK35649.1 urea ABC transporter permease subunit UrtC [Solwaraspora sp. WMMA2065]